MSWWDALNEQWWGFIGCGDLRYACGVSCAGDLCMYLYSDSVNSHLPTYLHQQFLIVLLFSMWLVCTAIIFLGFFFRGESFLRELGGGLLCWLQVDYSVALLWIYLRFPQRNLIILIWYDDSDADNRRDSGWYRRRFRCLPRWSPERLLEPHNICFFFFFFSCCLWILVRSEHETLSNQDKDGLMLAMEGWIT